LKKKKKYNMLQNQNPQWDFCSKVETKEKIKEKKIYIHPGDWLNDDRIGRMKANEVDYK